MSTLRIGDRSLALESNALRLSLRGRPPLALWSMDFELRARDADGEAHLESASPLPVPLGPFAGGGVYEGEVPLKDLPGTSFNLKLYVFEHAPIREATLRLDPLGPLRVRLTLRGKSDIWYAPHERNLPVEVTMDLAVQEVSVTNATGPADALALVGAAGLPLPEGARARLRFGCWRVTLAEGGD